MRGRGGWSVRGRAGHGLGATRGYDFDYDVPIALTAATTGVSRRPPAWNAILDCVPDATDAIASPGGDVVVVVTPRRLWIYAVAAGRLTTRRGMVPLPVTANVVMAQWATGRSVSRWTATVIPLLEAGIPSVQDRRQKH